MIRLFRLGGVQVGAGWASLPLLLWGIISGRGEALLYAIASVGIHELCHVIAARRTGVPVLSVELLPVGFMARMDDRNASTADKLIIAVCGPLASLVIASALQAASSYMPDNALLPLLADINIAIGLINIIPAYPLDGGRIAAALLTKCIGTERAERAMLISGMSLGLCMTALGVLMLMRGMGNLTPSLMGALLIVSAAAELTRSPARGAQRALMRCTAVSSAPMPVCHYCMDASGSILDAMRLMSGGRRTVILVTDNTGTVYTQLDESVIMAAATRYGTHISLGEIDQSRH